VSSDDLMHRLMEALMSPVASEDECSLKDELSDRPDLLEEYRRLEEVWSSLRELPVHAPPDGARERAEAAALEAMRGRGVGSARDAARTSWVERGDRDPGSSSWSRPAMIRTAAAVVIFLAGTAAGIWGVPRIVPLGEGEPIGAAGSKPDDRARFALFIRGGALPGNEAAAIDSMLRWARDLSADDRLVWASRFHGREAMRVGGDGPPHSETPPIGGLFVVRAADREEAVRLARGSPHLAWGGVVDVVPVADSR